MATSLNSIMDANQMRKAADAPVTRPVFGDFVDALSKMGARHGKKDKALVQTAHNALADLAGGVHCGEGEMEKANARHSKKDMDSICKCHDMLKGLGADCPGDQKETAK